MGGFADILWVWFMGLELVTPPKTNITMDKQPFEDVSPIKSGDFPLQC